MQDGNQNLDQVLQALYRRQRKMNLIGLVGIVLFYFGFLFAVLLVFRVRPINNTYTVFIGYDMLSPSQQRGYISHETDESAPVFSNPQYPRATVMVHRTGKAVFAQRYTNLIQLAIIHSTTSISVLIEDGEEGLDSNEHWHLPPRNGLGPSQPLSEGLEKSLRSLPDQEAQHIRSLFTEPGMCGADKISEPRLDLLRRLMRQALIQGGHKDISDSIRNGAKPITQYHWSQIGVLALGCGGFLFIPFIPWRYSHHKQKKALSLQNHRSR